MIDLGDRRVVVPRGNLEAIAGERVVIGGGYNYANERSAKRAGRRWAKEHNIEIMEVT
jgi:hypothetical protein